MARATGPKKGADFFNGRSTKNDTKSGKQPKPIAVASNRTGRKSGTRSA